VSWIAFTVPQNRHDETFFEALSGLVLSPEIEIYLALVRYHPAAQEPGTTEKQVRLVDQNLSAPKRGICTECGMARAEQEDVPALLDLHREIPTSYGR
jgi:hypothetical protein